MLRKTHQNQLPDDSERLSDVRQLSGGESEALYWTAPHRLQVQNKPHLCLLSVSIAREDGEAKER